MSVEKTMKNDSQNALKLIEKRSSVADLLKNIPLDMLNDIANGKSTNRDESDINGARDGVQIWQEEGAPDTYEMGLSEASSLFPGNMAMGYYRPGDDYINVMELFDEQRAADIAAYAAHDAEEENCIIDILTNEADREMITMHEGQHMKNYAKGIYEPTSDKTWLGCEAMAKINAADEIGARIAELGHVRDVYIKAGGQKEGLEALRDLASTTTHNAMINEYISKIESGEINPMSTKSADQKHEFEIIGKIAYNQWVNTDQEMYVGQLAGIGLRFAKANHLNNVKSAPKETKRRCDQAMTVDMTVNGKPIPVNFGQYLPEIKLPEIVQTQMSTLDNNQDLVAEYVKNGKDAFNDKTQKLENATMASKDVLEKPSHQDFKNQEQNRNTAVQAALDSQKLTR